MLVLTSLGFLLPTWVAFRNRKSFQSLQYLFLTISSMLFHGTHHPVARFIDIHYAHLLGIKYLIHSIHNVIAYKRKKDFALHLGTLASLYIYTSKRLPHTVFHVSVQYLFTVHAMDWV